MSKMAMLFSLVTLWIILSFTACIQRPLPGWGKENELYVLADSSIWTDCVPAISSIYERPLVTPQAEPAYSVRHAEIGKFKRFKNLIFLATLDSQEPVAQLVRMSLSDEVITKVTNENTQVFIQIGRQAILMTGLWRNDIKQAGGPFRSYTFYYKPDRRLYLLDYAIFLPRPNETKREYLMQGEVMMRTFITTD
jgi:hypothetical protein